MEFRPTFEDSPEPKHRSSGRSSGPRLAGEDGSVIPGTDEPLVVELEEDDESESGSRTDSREMEGPAWQGWVFALVPLLAILLGAAIRPWSRGLVALLAGVVMLVFPMRYRLPRLALAGIAGVVLAPLLAFLPASFHGAMPWREMLSQDWDIQLASFVTPQPWVTFEMWTYFTIGIVWLAWCLGRGFSQAQRGAMLRVLALGGVFLCWLSIMDGLKWFQVSWWPRHVDWGAGFGPFANRNHISSIAAMTGVLCAACAYDANRRKERMWIVFAAGFLVPATAIFINTSRAGLILLFVGMTLWLGFSAMRRGFFKKMAVTAAIVMLLAAALFVSRGGVSARLSGEGGDSIVSAESRFQIYRQSLQITAAAPWLGMGLGNFDAVFAIATGTHDPVLAQDPRMRSLHPESDVIGILTEGGLSTLMPCVVLLYWIARSTGPWAGRKSKDRSRRNERRLRNSAAIAMSLGVMHGLMDVPNHNLAYLSFMAVLAGIAVRPRRLPRVATWADRSVMMCLALAVCVVGASWLMVAFGRPVLPGTSSAQMLRMKARELANSGSAADALPLLDQAIAMRPLDFTLYFERAEVRLVLRQDYDAALLDFTRARVLEPHYAYMCYTEGVKWLSARPEYAILGWREFLRRFPKAGPGQHGYYRQMIQYSMTLPELRQQVWKLATTLELKLDYLTSVTTREDFEFCLREILSRQPDLASLDSAQRAVLFDLWSRLGDQEALMAAIESNKTWERDGGWKLLAAHYAKKSDFRRACEIASIYLPSLLRTTPGTSTDVQALERAFLFNPLDARLGIDLFQAYKNRGDLDGAIRALEKVRNATNPPAYLNQEMAAIYVAKEDFRRAWEHYREAADQPAAFR